MASTTKSCGRGSFYRAGNTAGVQMDADFMLDVHASHTLSRAATSPTYNNTVTVYMPLEFGSTACLCGAKRRRLSTVGKATDSACLCLDNGRCSSSRRRGIQMSASCNSVATRWRLQQHLASAAALGQLSRKRQQEHVDTLEHEWPPVSAAFHQEEQSRWIELQTACSPIFPAGQSAVAGSGGSAGLRLRPLVKARLAGPSASRKCQGAAYGDTTIPREGVKVAHVASGRLSLRPVQEAQLYASSATQCDPVGNDVQVPVQVSPVDTTLIARSAASSGQAAQTVSTGTTAMTSRGHTVTSGASTAATATSTEVPAPVVLPAEPFSVVWRRAAGDADGQLQGMPGRRLLVVDVEVATVAQGANLCTITSGVSPVAAPTEAAPKPEPRTGSSHVDRVQEAVPAVDSPSSAPGNQTVRLLLRLWPLANQPAPAPAGQAPASDAGPTASCRSQGAASKRQQDSVPLASPTQQPDTASPPLPAAACGGHLPSVATKHTDTASEPALPSLECLLEAAAAAASAATACARSLSVTSHGGFGGAGSCLAVACGQKPPLPTPRVEPAMFFEPDGSLLKGAVLQAACNVVRVAQLRGGVTISSPWGGQAGSLNSTAASTSHAAPAAPSRLTVVPLAGALQLLASYAGAAQALQLAEGRLAEELKEAAAAAADIGAVAKTARAAALMEAQDALCALRPLMRHGRHCAELLMAEVERVLTQTPRL